MNQRNILIVDDEITTRLAVHHQIKQLGNVFLARNSKEVEDCCKKIRKMTYVLDAAVVDLRISGSDTDGFGVIQSLTKHFPQIEVVILTVRNDQEALSNAKLCDRVRFLLTKPWRSMALVNAIENCLNGKAKNFQLIGEMEANEA